MNIVKLSIFLQKKVFKGGAQYCQGGHKNGPPFIISIFCLAVKSACHFCIETTIKNNQFSKILYIDKSFILDLN